MKETFRIAVSGLGGWARRAYLPNLEMMDDVEVVALSTRTPENMEAACAELSNKPRTYTDYREMLAEGGFDGVIVATNAASHKDLAAAALAAGYPVLCEKPLALTMDDCRELFDLAGAKALGLQVGLEFRHAPVLVKAVADIAAGKIGRPLLSGLRVLRDKRDGVVEKPERFLQHGGIFLEFLCHYLDVLCWLSGGTPVSVCCQAGQALGTEVYDHGAVQIAHSGGALASLEFSLLAPRSCEVVQAEVLGEEGKMVIGLATGEIVTTGQTGRDVFTAPDPGHPSNPYPGSYEQIRSFIDGVRESRPVTPGAEVWSQVMAVGNAAAESAESGERVLVTL